MGVYAPSLHIESTDSMMNVFLSLIIYIVNVVVNLQSVAEKIRTSVMITSTVKYCL